MNGPSVAFAPRAYPPTGIAGRYRVVPEDFFVRERLDADLAGQGEHLYLEVEKRLQNTRAVVEALAAAYSVATVDVGYAGLKDRRAVTRQWFSVRTPLDDTAPALPRGCRVTAASRHTHKLRRGALRCNRFDIRLRDVSGERGRLVERVATLAERGFPNYFGPQRFGIDGGNVPRALAYLGRRPRPRTPPWQHALHLSVARSVVFNAVLARRVLDGSWATLIDGDIADAGAPTGPLWGRGRSMTGRCAAVIEREALDACAAWLGPLEHVGLAQARRSFVARPAELTVAFEGDAVALAFDLGPGRYASVLLDELGEVEVATGGDA